MWECWNNENEKVIQRAFLIKKLSKEESDKLPFICPKCLEPLSFRIEHYRLFGKSKVRAHFMHKSDSQCYGYIPEGESEEHYNEKMKLLDLLNEEEYSLKIDGLTFDIKTNSGFIQFKDKEVSLNNRRADVLLTFKSPNSILGLGIAFEIMISEKEESIEQKIKYWTAYGYTVAFGKNVEEIETSPYLEKAHDSINQLKKELQESIEKTRFFGNQFIIKAASQGLYCNNCYKAWQCKKHSGCIVCYNENSPNHLLHRQDSTPCELWQKRIKPDIPFESSILDVKCKKVEQ